MITDAMRLTGVHHVSAVSAHINSTHRFYTQVLGMRPVIKTVNQDDPSMYHLFYGDGAGSPGSDMTIFDIPGAVREKRGNNSISLTTFRVAGADALQYWVDRFDELGVAHSGVHVRDGRDVIDADDVEGTQLSLIDDRGEGNAFPWMDSTVPAAFQIRGLGYTVITVPHLDATHDFLVTGVGLAQSHAYQHATGVDVHVYDIGSGGARAEVHVIVDPSLPRARHGSGGVHHVALRVTSDEHMSAWADHLHDLGYMNSGVVDRHYFRSVYVREPNHVLFELASDNPGFEVDGPLDSSRLSLPPFLEPRRAAIEASLKPLET